MPLAAGRGDAPIGPMRLEAMHDHAALREYMRLACAGTAMLALEWWGFEVLALAAGMIGTTQLAAHTVLASAC